MPKVNGQTWRRERARLRLSPEQVARITLTPDQLKKLELPDETLADGLVLTADQAARLDVTSHQAGQLLGIAGGALRSIELGIKPASLALAFRASDLYGCDVDSLLRNDEKPDEPPSKEQDTETNTGPGRGTGAGTGPGTGGRTAPKRATGAAA